MDPILEQKIIAKLTVYLNRSPSHSEIVNAQTDTRLMGWIRDDEVKAQKIEIETLKNKIK